MYETPERFVSSFILATFSTLIIVVSVGFYNSSYALSRPFISIRRYWQDRALAKLEQPS